jgi:hypothetical protein
MGNDPGKPRIPIRETLDHSRFIEVQPRVDSHFGEDQLLHLHSGAGAVEILKA